MKQFAILLALVLTLMAAGCGTGSSNSNNLNGNWTTTLVGTNGSPSFAFTVSILQNSDNTLSVSNLNFTTTTPCFTQGSTTESGGFTLSGNFNGVMNGTLSLLVQSTSGTNSTLNLQGTVNGNTVTGNWTLSGLTSGCAGAGTFTMQR